MRVVLALALLIGIAALAWVTFSGGGGSDRPAPKPIPGHGGQSVPDPRSPDGDLGSGTEYPPVVAEPRVEVPAYPWAEPEWKTAMAKAIARERVTLQVKGESLESVLRLMSGQFGWQVDVRGIPAEFHTQNISMDIPEVDPMNLLRMIGRGMKAKVHLRPDGIQILQEGVDPDWEGDEVFLAGLARAKAVLDAGGPKAAPVSKLLPVGFDRLTLRQILLELGNRVTLPVEFDPRVTRVQRDTRITLKSERMTVAQVLTDVTAEARLDWAAEERRILVTFEDRARDIRAERERAKANAAKEVELAVKDRPLSFVAEELGRQLGVPVVVDLDLWEGRGFVIARPIVQPPVHPHLTLRAGPEPLKRLIRRLAPLIPARFLIRGEAIYLIPPPGR